MSQPITIIADYREKPSGIPDFLLQSGVVVNFNQLKAGDYIINEEIVVERKSAEDFIQSLIAGRLFVQCAQLSKMHLHPLLLIEGDPCLTPHNIDKQAVKGALLSIATAWQIPILYAQNYEDSAEMIRLLAKQRIQRKHFIKYSRPKPKRIRNHRLQFLQGLPKIGAVTASRLLDHFGNIQTVINADVKALQEVEGIGKVMAAKIKAFLSNS